VSPFVVLCRRTGLERARKSEVQIIGGLAAAALLDRAGHGVTVHEQRGRQVSKRFSLLTQTSSDTFMRAGSAPPKPLPVPDSPRTDPTRPAVD